MNWVTEHLAQWVVVIGILLLVIEVWVLGFATFFLFFVGLGMIISGSLMYIDLLPDTLMVAALSTGVIAGVLALLLWKPLSNMQNKVDNSKVKSDLVGMTFMLTQPVNPTSPGVYRYSGIDWKLVSSEALPAGCRVEVTEANVGEFVIQRARD